MRKIKLKKIDTKFSIKEHYDAMTLKPFVYYYELPSMIYETLHIVDVFDKASYELVNDLLEIHQNQRYDLLTKIENNNEYKLYYKTRFWYLPGNNVCFTEETKIKGSLQICINFVQDGINGLMESEPQEFDKDHIVITLNYNKFTDMIDKLSIDDIKSSLFQVFKHEFKHIRTIWSKSNFDVLYNKKYANNPELSNYEKDAIKRYGYVSVSKELLYYFNPEEVLAFINGIYAKIQYEDKEKLLKIIQQSNTNTTTEEISYIIDYFDVNYYFGTIKKILSDIKNEYQNNIPLQYDLYNFIFKARDLDFFDEIYKDFNLNKISIEDFKKIEESERFSLIQGLLNHLNVYLVEIRRKLASAVYNYIHDIKKQYSDYLDLDLMR